METLNLIFKMSLHPESTWVAVSIKDCLLKTCVIINYKPHLWCTSAYGVMISREALWRAKTLILSCLSNKTYCLITLPYLLSYSIYTRIYYNTNDITDAQLDIKAPYFTMKDYDIDIL